MRRILKYMVIPVVIYLSSCADLLDVIPKHNLVGQNAIVDKTTAINALRGVYSYFQLSNNGYTIAHWANGAYLGGLCTNEIRYGFDNSLRQFTLSPVGTNVINALPPLYNAAYCIVNAANNVIYHTNLLNNISEEDKIEIIGEARFMRGYGLLTIMKNYSHFWNIDSPYGPIIRETPTTLETLYVPRSSIRDGYEFIIEDFRAAVKDSHDEQISVFRANRHVAKGFLAETLLMRGDNGDAAEALVLLEELTNQALSPFRLGTSFATLFNAANDYKNGGETMLAQGRLNAETIETYSTRTSSTLYAGYSKAIASALYCIHQSPDHYNELLVEDARYPYTWNNITFTSTTGVEKTDMTFIKMWRPEIQCPSFYMRLAQCYVMKAEALYFTGATVDQVIEPLNTLRARAGCELLVAADYPNTPTGKSLLRKAIVNEYVLECGIENSCEWYAMVRLKDEHGNRFVQYFNIYYTEEVENAMCLLIPDVDIVANKGIVIQNPFAPTQLIQ